MERVLVVGKATARRQALVRIAAATERSAMQTANGADALAIPQDEGPHVIVVDGEFDALDPHVWMEAVLARWPLAEVIVVFANRVGLRTIFNWERTDVFALLENPRPEIVRGAIQDAIETLAAWRAARGVPSEPPAGIVGRSPAIKNIGAQLARISRTRGSVLLEGETGTGKELFARTIHTLSESDGPFVAVNLAAVPGDLAESELFGHERGAFTGATESREGAFERAGGGTLLLDEVGEAPVQLQAKLLRVLQERCLTRVGGDREIPVRARVIAATNRNLEVVVNEWRFRKDLFHRIGVLRVKAPPLRDRSEDVDDLAPYLLGRHLAEDGRSRREWRITDGAMQTLREHAWPGNVRELDNTLQRAQLRARGCVIRRKDLEPMRSAGADGRPAPTHPPGDGLDAESSVDAFEALLARLAKLPTHREVEKRLIRAAMRKHGGNVSAAARELGMERGALRRRVAALEIDRAAG